MIKTSVIGQGALGEQVTAALAESGCHVLVHDESGWVARGGATTSSFSVADHVRMCDEIGVDVIFLCLPMRFRSAVEEQEFEAVLDEISQVRQAKNRERVIVVVGSSLPLKSTAWDMRCAPWGVRVVLSPVFGHDLVVLGSHITPYFRVRDLLPKGKFSEIRHVTLTDAVAHSRAPVEDFVNSHVPL